MRKAEEIKKRIEEIKEEFENRIFEELYQYVEESIDQAGAIGEIYSNKRIALERNYLTRVVN